MGSPFRTEREAYATVIIVSAVVLAVALAGVLGGAWAALGVFLALAFGLVVAGYALSSSSPPTTQRFGIGELAAQRELDGRTRVLVLANETLVGEALHAEIQHRAGGRGRVLVVAPVLSSRLRHWTSDTDQAIGEAQARLDRSLSVLRSAGIHASGQIGDGEPLQALEDALREFPADQAIISTHPVHRSHWLEANLVPKARSRFPLPITHVVVDLEHERARVEGSAPDPAGAVGASL